MRDGKHREMVREERLGAKRREMSNGEQKQSYSRKREKKDGDGTSRAGSGSSHALIGPATMSPPPP